MRFTFVFVAVLAEAVCAFPFVANMPGVDSNILSRARRQQADSRSRQVSTCPFNPNHVPAPGITTEYPYNEARNGLPGCGVGGYQVPAPGDTAHYFVPPGPDDIRGPCPGLNTAANHNFIAHDGITTYNELMDAQQNLYNLDYSVVTVLALLGVIVMDGDAVTERVSIGCDATSRTSIFPLLTGSEPGLNAHNRFECDISDTGRLLSW